MSTLREWHVKVVTDRNLLGDEDEWLEPIMATAGIVAFDFAVREWAEEYDDGPVDSTTTVYGMAKPADDEDDVTYWEATPEWVLHVNAKKVDA